VSRRLCVAPDTVRTWRRRFLRHGLDGLSDEPRPGIPRKNTGTDAERSIVKMLEEKVSPVLSVLWQTKPLLDEQGFSLFGT
jgi:transposase